MHAQLTDTKSNYCTKFTYCKCWLHCKRKMANFIVLNCCLTLWICPILLKVDCTWIVVKNLLFRFVLKWYWHWAILCEGLAETGRFVIVVWQNDVTSVIAPLIEMDYQLRERYNMQKTLIDSFAESVYICSNELWSMVDYSASSAIDIYPSVSVYVDLYSSLVSYREYSSTCAVCAENQLLSDQGSVFPGQTKYTGSPNKMLTPFDSKFLYYYENNNTCYFNICWE